jgi:hypothetical protein
MENFDVLIILHDKIDYVRYNLIKLLGEIDNLYPNNNESLPEYTRLLYLNYISLSELSYSIKEYFILKNILIHKF